jgi:hypothetical protein
MKQDGGNEHLLRDLLMKLGETPISIYRCVHLIENPDTPWDAQKILLLVRVHWLVPLFDQSRTEELIKHHSYVRL